MSLHRLVRLGGCGWALQSAVHQAESVFIVKAISGEAFLCRASGVAGRIAKPKAGRSKFCSYPRSRGLLCGSGIERRLA
jgi:hypothetical protein